MSARRGLMPLVVLVAIVGVGLFAAAPASAIPLIPPNAALDVSPNQAHVGETVNFDASDSTDDAGGAPGGAPITDYDWDLNGDGFCDDDHTDTTPTTTRIYNSPQTITVKVCVTDSETDTGTATDSLEIINDRPVANFIFTSPPVAGDPITFSSTSTDTEDGTIPGVRTRWDFDNDGQFDDATGQSPEHTFATAGPQQVGIEVEDANGATDSRYKTVNVQPPQPDAAFTFSPATPLTNETITFDGSGSAPPAGQTITAWSWDLDGDGAFDDASGPAPSTSYSTPGPRIVQLRVDASGGGFDVTAQSVNIGNRSPTASFDFSPQKARPGDKLRLTSTSSDPDGPIANTQWDLDNDGQFDDATGATAELRVPKKGKTIVGIRVVDANGADNAVHTEIPTKGGGARTLMAPFPVVRLSGEITPGGKTQISRLSVRGPKGSDVDVRCQGSTCPFRHRSRAVKKHRVGFPGIERTLSPGVVLKIYVTDAKKIGKFTRFKMRPGKVPKRKDSCLKGNRHKPIPCPR